MNTVTLIPDIDPTYTTRKVFYSERLRDSDTLIISVGDSWTWGDCLGKINSLHLENATEPDDYEHRTTHIWGQLVADKFNADHLLIARPGGWNSELFDKLKDALPHVYNRYTNIYVVACLTELGREMWGDPLWVPQEKFEYVDEFLQAYERNMLNSFKTGIVDAFPKLKLLMTRNFTYTYPENLGIVPHANKIWIDILDENQQNPINYPDTVRFITTMAVVPTNKRLKELGIFKKYKYQLLDNYADSQLAEEWFPNSPLNFQFATKHPTEKGHELWAEYIYNTLKENT